MGSTSLFPQNSFMAWKSVLNLSFAAELRLNGRRSTLGACALLIEKCERFLNAHDAGDARPAFSTCAEGSQPDDLACSVEEGPARVSRVNVDVRHDGVRLDLADDAGGDDLIEAERAADGEHALAFLDRSPASPGPIQRGG